MTQSPLQILPNFGIKNVQQFILYVSTTIFMLSLFIPIQGLTLSVVQRKSLIITVVSAIAWFLRSSLWSWVKMIDDDTRKGNRHPSKSDEDMFMWAFGILNTLHIFIVLVILGS
ncbi:hypothetical protein K9M74_04245 [Candidatus Woesearchaeota archaeon]|nr:hypothetical protein [Candidatus Woesearchaeota archaeon]